MANCEFHPPVGQFNPALEWAWARNPSAPPDTIHDVVGIPAVIDLNNDQIPEIIFAFKHDGSHGALRAVSGLDGTELFTVTDPVVSMESSLTAGDIDNDGLPETIIPSGNDLLCFENNGQFKWRSPTLENRYWGAPAIGDLEGDGIPEIIMGRQVLNNDGTLRWTGTGGKGYKYGSLSYPVDLDLDGAQEVLCGNTAYRSNGGIYWKNSLADGLTAVANFDDDPFPEIVHVAGSLISMVEHTGAVKWGPVAIPGGGGGPPTIADFNGDGKLEIGVAGASRYVVFNANGVVLWKNEIDDSTSGATGSSVFDFDGDGSFEVVYRDERYPRIYRGSDGHVLFETPMSFATWYEYPVIADVDNDGNAEIVVTAYNYANYPNQITQQGLYVFGDANDTWVNTRKIWNQHAYSITNVNDDGTIPAHPANNWQTFNNFRCNQSLDALACVDLTASFLRINSHCPDSVEIIARIGNGGALQVAPGVNVSFFNGDPESGGALLGVAETTKRIYPGQCEDVSISYANPPQGLQTIYVVADKDAGGKEKHREVDEENNIAQAAFDLCNNAPEITSTPVTTGIEGVSYAHDVEATDPDADSLTYRLNRAPVGMTINPTSGRITWTPDGKQAGNHAVNVRVSDSRGGIDVQEFTITVAESINNPPEIISAPLVSAFTFESYYLNLARN